MVKPGDNVVALHGQKEECPGHVLRCFSTLQQQQTARQTYPDIPLWECVQSMHETCKQVTPIC